MLITKNFEITVPLKYLSNFWRTIEMPLINCKINLILSWPENCVISSAIGATKFAINDTKFYVLVVTLSNQVNAKLLQQLKSSFKRTTNWNKYHSKISRQAPNSHLDILIYPSFQGVNRLFVLSFENKDDTTIHTKYYLATVEIKDYHVMIDGQNFFDQPVKNDLRTFHNIRKFDQGDAYTTGCMLDYNYFKYYYKMKVIDLSKHKAHDTDPIAIQQLNFTRDINRREDVNDNTVCLSLLKKRKKLF